MFYFVSCRLQQRARLFADMVDLPKRKDYLVTFISVWLDLEFQCVIADKRANHNSTTQKTTLLQILLFTTLLLLLLIIIIIFFGHHNHAIKLLITFLIIHLNSSRSGI